MNRQKRNAVLAAVALISLIGCATSSTKPEHYSGFLKDYSGLQPVQAGYVRFINPKFNPSDYNAVLVEPVLYYPRPTPNEQVSRTTLTAIAQYINEALRAKIGNQVKMVDQPGPGVARLQVAVTAVGAQDQALKPYQYIPIAFLVAKAKETVTGTPELAALSIEAEVSDSVSGERLAASVRSGVGERLQQEVSGVKVVTLEDVKPVIDKGIEGVAGEITRYVR